MEPGQIIRWSLAGEPFHRYRIVLEKGDLVAQHHLKWGEGTFLSPLVKYFLGLVKTAHHHESLAGIGIGCRRRDRRIVDCPIEFLQGLFRSAQLRVSDT